MSFAGNFQISRPNSGAPPTSCSSSAADFRAFARAASPVLFPGRPLVWSPAYDYLCEVLTLVARRDPCFRRVIINQPPRTGKSFLGIGVRSLALALRSESPLGVCATSAECRRSIRRAAKWRASAPLRRNGARVTGTSVATQRSLSRSPNSRTPRTTIWPTA
jgi:hypothetical protein